MLTGTFCWMFEVSLMRRSVPLGRGRTAGRELRSDALGVARGRPRKQDGIRRREGPFHVVQRGPQRNGLTRGLRAIYGWVNGPQTAGTVKPARATAEHSAVYCGPGGASPAAWAPRWNVYVAPG